MQTKCIKFRPIFICGVQRSGTTLLRLLLNAHPEIAIPHESFVLIDFYHRLSHYNLKCPRDRKLLIEDLLNAKGIRDWQPKVEKEDVDLNSLITYPEIINEIYSCYAKSCGKKIWGDKTPSYICDLHIINELFPECKIIHIIRDGRDVALSLERQSWGPNGFVSALNYWKEIIYWSRKMGRLLPNSRYLEVKYEELVSNSETILKNIFNFLKIDFDISILRSWNKNIEINIPPNSKKHHTNINGNITSAFINNWVYKLPKIDQALAQKIAGRLFSELGYPEYHTHISNFRLRNRRIYHYFKENLRWRFNLIKKRF